MKQLQEIFNELNLSECLEDIIPTSAKLLGEMKEEMNLALEGKVIQINKDIDAKIEEQIDENIKPIARKKKKKERKE